MEAGFTEDEISTTYDERMLTVLNKAAKYDNMMRNKPCRCSLSARARCSRAPRPASAMAPPAR